MLDSIKDLFYLYSLPEGEKTLSRLVDKLPFFRRSTLSELGNTTIFLNFQEGLINYKTPFVVRDFIRRVVIDDYSFDFLNKDNMLNYSNYLLDILQPTAFERVFLVNYISVGNFRGQIGYIGGSKGDFSKGEDSKNGISENRISKNSISKNNISKNNIYNNTSSGDLKNGFGDLKNSSGDLKNGSSNLNNNSNNSKSSSRRYFKKDPFFLFFNLNFNIDVDDIQTNYSKKRFSDKMGASTEDSLIDSSSTKHSLTGYSLIDDYLEYHNLKNDSLTDTLKKAFTEIPDAKGSSYKDLDSAYNSFSKQLFGF